MKVWVQRTTATFLMFAGVTSALIAFFGGLLAGEWFLLATFIFASVGFFAGAQELRPRRRIRPPDFLS